MSGISLFPVFVVGLLGSAHCAGMCGGIVGAFSAAPQRPAFPVAVVHVRADAAVNATVRVLSYNAGRIASYALAGALAGTFGAGMRALAAVQAGGLWLANLMLIALGLHLMNAWRGLDKVEAAGQVLWRRLRPLMGAIVPADTPFKLLMLGALWGWLPCAMVYSMLVTAMLSGSAASGAAVMAAFGLGTLPMLFALGAIGQQVRAAFGKRGVRVAAGVVVLGFGILGLVRAANGVPGWFDLLCVSGAA
jgi:sulfite exporter TauE/SafE